MRAKLLKLKLEEGRVLCSVMVQDCVSPEALRPIRLEN